MIKHRVTLLHNSEAGFENYSPELLISLLEQRGYSVAYSDSHAENVAGILCDPGELVVVAGGDGTVGKIARRLIDKSVPIAILPFGTANNVATSLGIFGTPEDIIAAWDLSQRQPFDIGIVKETSKETFFLESLGFGLFAKLIRLRDTNEKNRNNREDELCDARLHQLDLLRNAKPYPCTLRIDGEQLEDEYIMLEIMNTPFNGANLLLAPDAKVDDGLLDVVLIAKSERKELAEVLSSHLNGHHPGSALPVRRCRTIEVQWHGGDFHNDDEVCHRELPVTLKAELKMHAVEFLTGMM